MPSNLYETLGVGRNATQEEIRKAYRRRALETHPDRLPQGVSAAEKSASEDMFRKVNNAYEVLSDPQTRASYDQHGVWPPPTSAPPFPNGPNEPFFNDPFSQPFFRGPRTDPFGGFGPFGFGSRHDPRGFTDPFVLFNSIFGDFHRAFESDPFFGDPFGRRGFGSSSSFGGGFFGNGFPSIMPSPYDYGGGGSRGNRMQTFSSGGNGGRWVSESWTSSTVNGVTRTKCVRKDSEGNEHVIYRYPDGTERRMVNGVEQSSSQSQPQPQPQPQRTLPAPAPYPNQVSTMPPPPPYSEAVGQQPRRSRSSRHHYDDYYGDGRDHRYGRDYDNEWGSHGYRDDRYGHDVQNGSSWMPWK